MFRTFSLRICSRFNQLSSNNTNELSIRRLTAKSQASPTQKKWSRCVALSCLTPPNPGRLQAPDASSTPPARPDSGACKLGRQCLGQGGTGGIFGRRLALCRAGCVWLGLVWTCADEAGSPKVAWVRHATFQFSPAARCLAVAKVVKARRKKNTQWQSVHRESS